MNILLKLAFVISWIFFLLIKFAAVLLGFVFVPLAIRLDFPRWLWIYGNDEHGYPDWWVKLAEEKGGFIAKFPRFWWYAIRNPVNNVRFLFDDYRLDQCSVDTDWDFQTNGQMEARELIAANEDSAYLWVWRGWKAGYRRVWLNGDNKYSEIWFGWKLGSPVPGLGFTSQVRLEAEIGT